MTLLYFILILGITVFIHELGHYIFAKRAGIYVYEFSLGMGPQLYSFRRKNDETKYAIRLFPIGGYVQMAGEEVEPDENIPLDKRLQSKTWMERFLTIIAGCLFNFILAVVLLFTIGLINGTPELKPIIGKLTDNYPAIKAGIDSGDLITHINGEKVSTVDDVLLKLELTPKGEPLDIKVNKENGSVKEYVVTPLKTVVDGEDVYRYGFAFSDKVNRGIIESLNYAVVKFVSIFKSMILVIGGLITGDIGFNNLAGPVGIYNIVGEEAKAGIVNILSLIAFLSINVGFINLLPFPAFDGGRVVFLIIEKIKGSPINPKVENAIHLVGFALLMLLMILITYQDISRLVK